MSKMSTRTAAAEAVSVIVAGGIVAGGATAAQADSWDGTVHMSAQEVMRS